MHRKSSPTETDQDELVLLKLLIRLSMLVELDANGGQLTDMMEFLVKPFTIGFRIWSHNRIFEHAFYKLSTAYRSQYQYPLIADTSYVKNIFGKDVISANATDRGIKAIKVSFPSSSGRDISFQTLCTNLELPCALMKANMHLSRVIQLLHFLCDDVSRISASSLDLHGL